MRFWPRAVARCATALVMFAAGTRLALAIEADPLQELREEIARERQQLAQDQARIEALEQRLAVHEAAATATAAQAPQAPSNSLAATFGSEGFSLQNADASTVLRLRGNLSVDGRYFADSYTPDSANTWLIRRLRPTFEGTLAGRYDFRFMPDFGLGKTIIQDAWAAVRISPQVALQFGKFKAPVGLERLQLEQFARFIEVALPSALLPYRDLGVKAGGALGGGALAYDLGVFDGAPDGGSTDANSVPDQNSSGSFTLDGRLFGRPFVHSGPAALRGLGLGIAATYLDATGKAAAATSGSPASTVSLLASYKTPGQQPMFSYRTNSAAGGFNSATIAAGIQRRWAPQFYYYYRSWSVLGEYVEETQQVGRRVSLSEARTATLKHTAWQVQGAWFVTGEDEAYDRATPRRNFEFGRGGSGAWELVARYHQIRFDPAALAGGALSFADPHSSVLAAYAVGTGVNWYLNPNFKVQLDYEVTRFEGGTSGGDRPDERVLTSQFALIY